MIQGQAVEAACQPARKPLAGWRLPEGMRATLARRPLPFLLVTGVVSGSTCYRPVVKEPSYTCAPSAPGCLAASSRRPDYDRQLLAHPPVSAEPAGAVSGCRYGPMRENPACSDRSGRAAPVAPETALPAHLTVCEETAPDGAAVLPPAATPAACFPLWTFRGADVTPSRSICPG